MHGYSAAAYINWIVTLVLNLAALVGLYRRGSYKDLPLFTTYIIYAIACSPVMFVLLQISEPVYFYGYWIAECLGALLQLLVTMEVLSSLLADRPHWKKLGASAVQYGTAALILITVAVASLGISTQSNPVTIVVLAVDRSLRLAQFGLLVIVIVMARILHLEWTKRLFGITAGLAMMAACTLVVLTVRLQFGRLADPALTSLKPAVYVLAGCVWATCAWSTDAKRAPASITMEQAAGVFRWREVLSEISAR